MRVSLDDVLMDYVMEREGPREKVDRCSRKHFNTGAILPTYFQNAEIKFNVCLRSSFCSFVTYLRLGPCL